MYVHDNPGIGQGLRGMSFTKSELLNGEGCAVQEDMFGVPEYYIPVEQLREDGIWKRLEAE